MRIPPFLAASAAIGSIAVPAAAQTPYPYPQQQTSPPGYGYPGQGYGVPGQGGIAGIINQLLGNRYNVTDRQAVTQCAAAAQAQASRQYRPSGYGAYGQPPYGNAYGYQGQGMARVTGITNVERRRNGLRVTGVIDSGMAGGYGAHPYPGYGNQGYNQAYGAAGDLSFSCTVDYRGAITKLRVTRNNSYRGY